METTLLPLVLVPLAIAGMASLVTSNRLRPWLLPLGSGAHLLFVARAVGEPSSAANLGDRWLDLDPLAKVFLVVVSLMHFLCMLYAPGYLQLRPERPNRVMCVCLLVSLSMMTLVILSHHLGLMWVALEATTLASAPSIYFNHNPRSLEATWKFLLLCSVGIALALLGSFFLAYSAVYTNLESSLFLEKLLQEAPQLSKPWLHAAFVLLFVGYGTKMGLAPMHTWKPDAYGEAPGLVGALLAGGVTNCAFFAVLRVYQVCHAAGDPELNREMQQMMIFIGLLSMATAAVFMVRQRDVKRLLAYSSVEHMGILVFGIGLGGGAVYGALLHVVNNALTKGVLFLSAANIHRAYGSKFTEDVHGAMRVLPFSGAMLLTGFIAGCGSPPFAPFVSEFTILNAAFDSHLVLGCIFLLLLAIVFIGMGTTILSIVLGNPPESVAKTAFPEGPRTCAPILTFMALVLFLGLYLPPWLRTSIENADKFLNLTPVAEAKIVAEFDP